MYDFEELVARLLSAKPELNREELTRKIAEKKETVGAGYLTDQGALFLIAGELGVALHEEAPTSDLAIKDLYIGANDVTVVGRVSAVYPVSTYKKKDGGVGKYRRMVLFDKNHSVKLTVWDEKAEEIEKDGVKVGAAVRVSDGYVKQGLDGRPNLNLGKRGKIEMVTDSAISSKLAGLADVTEKPSNLVQEREILALESVVVSEPRYSEFVRSDGSPGSLFQFGVSAVGGKGEVRIVIWSPSARPDLRAGQRVVITNLKARRTSSGEFEIHGDAGSNVAAVRAETVRLRVAAISKEQGKILLLGLDKGRGIRVVEVDSNPNGVLKDDVVEVSPDHESGGRLVSVGSGSVQVVKESALPNLAELGTKLRDAKKEGSQVMVEVIALSQGTSEEVHLKDGTSVNKGELVVGDDTGEVKVVGWREQSAKVDGIQPGERLRIVGVSPKLSRMGAWTLELAGYSVVEKIRGRG